MPDVRLRRVLVSTGDSSGDLILSKVIEELKKNSPTPIEFIGLCGPRCIAAGVTAIGNTKDVAVVGLVEVLKNLKKIFGTLERLSQELKSVDSVICVDFPDFNLRLAEMAKKKSIPVDYIVAPQVWAWRSNRLPKIQRLVRRLYPALPFEEGLFREAGVDAHYLGHPLRDLLPPRNRRESREEFGLKPDDFVFCIMPGSRNSEISRHLPLILEAWADLRKSREKNNQSFSYRALVPVAPGFDEAQLKELLPPKLRETFSQLVARNEWKLVFNSHRALMACDFGWITSGTATLEAAYYQLPHILLYKLNALSAFMVARLTSYFTRNEAFAGLPNILLGKMVIPELLQNNLTSRRLSVETTYILDDKTKCSKIAQELRWIPKKLGEAGATLRIAADLLKLWESTPITTRISKPGSTPLSTPLATPSS